MTADVVFLVDVDNTLLDNDRIIADLRQHLEEEFGLESADRYWASFEQLRGELGYADYLGALQRYRADIDHCGEGDHRLLLVSSFLVDYPFVDRLYPRALDVVAHLRRLGPTVILTDGRRGLPAAQGPVLGPVECRGGRGADLCPQGNDAR